MDELIEKTLESELELPVYQFGSQINEDDYPDAFFTFWNTDTKGAGYYDNKPSRLIWEYELNYFARTPMPVHTTLAKAVACLKKEGFAAAGVGYDVESDVTSHTGRGIQLSFTERIKKKGSKK